MEEKEKLVLDFMKEEAYVPMKAKEMAVILEVPTEEYRAFTLLLKKLEEEYKIQKNRKARYSIVDDNKYKMGDFRANEQGFGFVRCAGEEEEIHISKTQTKGALNGDTVLIEVQKEENTKFHREGKIIRIVRHNITSLVGTFQSSRNFGFVVPDDKKLGTDIFISKGNTNHAKNNDKVVVEIIKYPEEGKNAEGKIVEILGQVNQAGVDMLSLIREYHLPYEFPQNVIQEAQNVLNRIEPKEIEGRLDLRKEEIFTIDGEDAKDLDDAVYVKKLENGNYELGVHIADVSHYVKEGSSLDKEALLRGTSIYLLDRVIPMLPKELSNGICSLNAGVDRLALSAIMEIDKQGEVVASDIQKTVIHVTKRMSYTGVSVVLKHLNKEEVSEEQQVVLEEYKPYIEHIARMEELARLLKQRREKQGSLNLDIPESKIILDENGFAIDVQKYELSFANEVIEQFMLTANEAVAERFYWIEAPFIYRVHEEPDEEKVGELNKFLWNLGYRIKSSKENIHPTAFAEVLEKVKGKEEEKVVSNLVLRTLKVARYENVNKGHFGIASKCYCHFTSPIRRYPDLFIHRIISSYIDKKYHVSEEFKEKYQSQAKEDAEKSSEREKIAQKVERDSADIKKAEYMEHHVGEEYDAIISSITSFGIFAELENTIEGFLRFDSLGNEYFIYDEDKKTLTGEKTKKVYKIGDKIKIKVSSASKILRRIDFECIEE